MKTYFSAILSVLLISLSTVSLAQTYDFYNNQAKDAYDKGNYDLCIECCNKSISVQQNGWAYWERGNAYFELKKFPEAAKDFTSGITYYSSDNSSLAKLYYYLGYCDIKNFKIQDAITDLNKASDLGYSEYGYLYRDLGYSYNLNLEYEKSINAYKKAVNYFDSNINEKAAAYESLGYVQKSAKQYDDALENLGKAIDLNPGQYLAYEDRAGIREIKKEYTKAKEDITKAINYTPVDGVASSHYVYLLYEKRGVYNWNLNKYEEGIADCLQSIALDSTYNFAWWYLGLSYSDAGYNEKAIKAYTKAIALTKDTSDLSILYRNRSIESKKIMKYTTALSDCNKSIQLTPKYKIAYWTRAEIYVSTTQYANAFTDYDKAIQYYNDDKASLASLYRERGLLDSKTGDIEKASYDFNKSLELDSTNISTLYETGRFLKEKNKNLPLARAYLQRCVDRSLTTDTGSTYSYAKIFLEEKEAALNNFFRLADKYRFDKYQYKWELHNITCFYSLTGNSAKAFEYLEKELQEGFTDYDHLVHDRDLNYIRKMPQYNAILTKYKVSGQNNTSIAKK